MIKDRQTDRWSYDGQRLMRKLSSTFFSNELKTGYDHPAQGSFELFSSKPSSYCVATRLKTCIALKQWESIIYHLFG